MSTPDFAGSIPSIYQADLVPLIFDAYARDMVPRLDLRPTSRVLELAAGTGVVTRQILAALAPDASLLATDVSKGMLAIAEQSIGGDPRVRFAIADACELQHPDASFDRIASQFGVMFFADKIRAMRQARRVLAPGGRYVFNVWDSLEHNPIAKIVHETAAAHFPANPPSFLGRMPFAYTDTAEIERVIRAGGFTSCHIERVKLPCIGASAEAAARAFIQGSPLCTEIVERGMTDLTRVREAAAGALAKRFGDHPCRATMQAIIVTAS